MNAISICVESQTASMGGYSLSTKKFCVDNPNYRANSMFFERQAIELMD
jgi:hypothetical protein